MNLRGVKESGKAFAVPTYGFLIGIYAMFAVAGYRMLSGSSCWRRLPDCQSIPSTHTWALL